MHVVTTTRFYNGSVLNAPCEVIYDEWRDLIQRNVCQDTKSKTQDVGMAFVMADHIEAMAIDKVDEVSLHEFPHPCI